MLHSRVLGLGNRRLPLVNHSSLHKTPFLVCSGAYAGTTAISRHRHTKRQASTNTTSSPDANILLAKQRLNRPISPHLSIYKPQVSWTLSALNRITGCILSGGFYVFGTAYLAAPLFGWHLDTATMAAAFASWPLLLQLLAKLTMALPFTFHSFNGVRHLIWDMGKQMKNPQVIRTGWTVVGLTILSALGLALV